MLDSEIIHSLQEDKNKLLEILRQIHAQSQNQREFLKNATSEEIEKFALSKKNKLDILNHLILGIETKISKLKEEVRDKFLFKLKEEYQAILQDILDIELQDKDIFSKMKEAIGLEIIEIQQTRFHLKTLRKAYTANRGDALTFDAQG